jgi:hypothetical protein
MACRHREELYNLKTLINEISQQTGNGNTEQLLLVQAKQVVLTNFDVPTPYKGCKIQNSSFCFNILTLATYSFLRVWLRFYLQ